MKLLIAKIQRGQGLVEYTFIVFLITLNFWLGSRGTSVGEKLADLWTETVACVDAPFSCGS